jgi:dihydrodipicolinate synthase/N-acetylneuraminate lyase
VGGGWGGGSGNRHGPAWRAAGMSATIRLPGRAQPLLVADPGWERGYPPPVSRSVYAAAHVAATPDGEVDWESTIGFRDFLWDYGFGVAEAMDTAQRGMGLSWPQARELIARSAARAADRGSAVACGAGTDQLPPGRHPLPDVVKAYQEQLELVQSAGADVILMASRALAASARSGQDYLDVYLHLLRQADRPVILHWLGTAFDAALAGYWGAAEFEPAADLVARLAERADGKVAGVKLSVLDARHEAALRRRLPSGVRLYTGDDFHYDELIRGDADGHSDALLGAFAAVTAPAAAALRALDTGDLAGYQAAIGPTMPLSRAIFEEPTFHYKVGVAFLAWLNGLQPHFAMLGGLQRQRSREHLIRVFELAAAAGALLRPGLAVRRMTQYLTAR